MSDEQKIDRSFLLETLERFGGDPNRWPDRSRGALQALIANDPEAKALVAEFAALDQVLTRAGDVSEDANHAARHDALANRIMRRVATEPHSSKGSGENVVAFERVHRPTPLSNFGYGRWPNAAAASALAASLLLGITVGVTGVANSTLTPVSEALGLGSIATETAALSDPVFDVVDGNAFDEDVL